MIGTFLVTTKSTWSSLMQPTTMPASRAIWTGPWPCLTRLGWLRNHGISTAFWSFCEFQDFFSRILGVPIIGQVTSAKIFEEGETLWKVHVAGWRKWCQARGTRPEFGYFRLSHSCPWECLNKQVDAIPPNDPWTLPHSLRTFSMIFCCLHSFQLHLKPALIRPYAGEISPAIDIAFVWSPSFPESQ
jgi:hypothetical protein